MSLLTDNRFIYFAQPRDHVAQRMFSGKQIKIMQIPESHTFTIMAIVNRRFRRKKKSTKCRNRFRNTSAMQLFKLNKK